jgi:putative redox protein
MDQEQLESNYKTWIMEDLLNGTPWKEINAEWKGDSSFVAANLSGGTIQIGTVDDHPGIGPMELLLAGLAGCTGMDIASILLKKRQKLVQLKVNVRGKIADDFPKIYTDIEVTYLLWGDNLNPKDIEQAIQLSEEKYCSVGLMLRKSANVTSKYLVNQTSVIPEPTITEKV